jgi:6-methylsalicylate decarboxylase
MTICSLGFRVGGEAHDADIDSAHIATVLHGLYYETALAAVATLLLPSLEVTTTHHILFGTDRPAAPESTLERNIANLTSFDGFTAEQRRGVERDNALAVFPRFA